MGRAGVPAKTSVGGRKWGTSRECELVDNRAAKGITFPFVPLVCEERPRKVRSSRAVSHGNGLGRPG